RCTDPVFTLDEGAIHTRALISASAFSSQNRMSISRYIVVAGVGALGPPRACPCAGTACRGRGGSGRRGVYFIPTVVVPALVVTHVRDRHAAPGLAARRLP